MRRTKATLIYRRTRNLQAVQLLLGHSKLESTVRYLGIEVDDTLEISEQTEIWPPECRLHVLLLMGFVRPVSVVIATAYSRPIPDLATAPPLKMIFLLGFPLAAIGSTEPICPAGLAPVQRLEPFAAPYGHDTERRLTESTCRSNW